ncbi:RNA-directed DNA polymerase, eukaryota, reverse transcriptase zinc-binding domain protein [Tanacetum coccineum]
MVGKIITCVSTTFSICVNGERFGYYKAGRGLSQDDPMSPYLFTLMVEILFIIVQEKVKNRKEFKYHFGCRSMKLTHVCFVDDLLMRCHGDMNSVNVLKEAIEDFGAYSSLISNYTKSTIIFGSMNNAEKKNILDNDPFKVERLPIKYLGVPLTSKRIRVNNYKSLLDRIRNMILNWKNKCLSYAGRLQLVASVLEYVHVYWAFVLLLSKAVIKDINKLLKGFFWNQDEMSREKPKVA